MRPYLACFINHHQSIWLQGNLLAASSSAGGEDNAGLLQRCLDCAPVQEPSRAPDACQEPQDVLLKPAMLLRKC